MTKKEKEWTLSLPTIGVYSESAFSGIEVKRIKNDGEYVLYVEVCGDKRSCHYAKIRFNCEGNPFILYHGRRLYFDNILKV
jgi:hypothetical protein